MSSGRRRTRRALEISAELRRRMSPEARARHAEARREYFKSLTTGVVVRDSPMGRVYFIEAAGTDRIKIGWTAQAVELRLKQIRTGSPVDLVILGSFAAKQETEHRLHRQFRALRVRPGGEWFHASDELRAYIAHMQERFA